VNHPPRRIAVVPARYQPRNGRADRQSFVVQLTQPDGITRDVTRRPQVHLRNPAIVKLE